MIVVEFSDWFAPRKPDNKCVLRRGLLLSVGHVGHNHTNQAFVITAKMRHDDNYGEVGDNIILAVELKKVHVKGMNIPFEP